VNPFNIGASYYVYALDRNALAAFLALDRNALAAFLRAST